MGLGEVVDGESSANRISLEETFQTENARERSKVRNASTAIERQLNREGTVTVSIVRFVERILNRALDNDSRSV